MAPNQSHRSSAPTGPPPASHGQQPPIREEPSLFSISFPPLCLPLSLCQRQVLAAASLATARADLIASPLSLFSFSESCSLQPLGLHSPWNSPSQNTGVGSHSLLQGIFPTQGMNPGLLHCRQILYHLSHQGSPSESKYIPLNVVISNL